MKTTTLALALLALGWMSACKKDPPKQYSYWTVNGDSFRTNNIALRIDKTGTALSGETNVSSFVLAWGSSGYTIGLPTHDSSYLIDLENSNPKPNYFVVIIGYQGQSYRVAQPWQYLSAGLVNGKAQYRLNHVWFRNHYNHEDSVLVSGTFNQP